MAFDKVIDSAALDRDLKIVADAIRAKRNTSDKLVFPNGFKTAIDSISAGGNTSYNCESIVLEIPNLKTSFQNKEGTIEVWGWGATGTSWADSQYIFLGTSYASYIGGEETTMSVSIDAKGNLIGLPDFLTMGKINVMRKSL